MGSGDEANTPLQFFGCFVTIIINYLHTRVCTAYTILAVVFVSLRASDCVATIQEGEGKYLEKVLIKCRQKVVNEIFGASLSEPRTSELNGGFFIYYILYIISAVRTSLRKCKLTLF